MMASATVAIRSQRRQFTANSQRVRSAEWSAMSDWTAMSDGHVCRDRCRCALPPPHRRGDRSGGRADGPRAAPARPQPRRARGARFHRQGRVDAGACRPVAGRRWSRSASVTSRRRRRCATRRRRSRGPPASAPTSPPTSSRRRRRRRHRRPSRDRGRAARRLSVPRSEDRQVRVRASSRRLSLVVGQSDERAATRGIAQGVVNAGAANLARDLANTPANLLTARAIAAQAVELAGRRGLAVEVFDRDQLEAMGCGGMIGVNAGSIEPPRMVKLTYTPRNPKAHVALVGKGVMYDSGGLSLKPTNPMSAIMKMDMSGAAAVLAAMTALKAARLPQQGDGVADVHRQHAVGLGAQARRRAHVPQRQDGRDPQHRCRGSADPRRRTGAGGRGEARRDRRHRHPHRRGDGRARDRLSRP